MTKDAQINIVLAILQNRSYCYVNLDGKPTISTGDGENRLRISENSYISAAVLSRVIDLCNEKDIQTLKELYNKIVV